MKITVYVVTTCIPERGEGPCLPSVFGTETAAEAHAEVMLKAEWATYPIYSPDDDETVEPYPGNWRLANDRLAAECGDGSWGKWELTSHEIEIAIDQTGANGDALCAKHGNDFWGECPDQPRSDWRCQVANGDTSLGYWEWAAARISNDATEESSDDPQAPEGEGWGLFDIGTDRCHIQRDDEAGIFAADNAAWEHVWRRAAESAGVYADALLAVRADNPDGYAEIEAHCYQALGYSLTLPVDGVAA